MSRLFGKEWVRAARHVLRVYPALLRVGFADIFAYRAELVVWLLTVNMPLVMMALWTAVAATGPVGRFGQREFVAYYLGMLLVRILTGSWLVWELTMEIRQGTLAPRLLRPIHPLWAHSAMQLAAVPFRVVLVSPLVFILYWDAGERLPLHEPLRLAILREQMPINIGQIGIGKHCIRLHELAVDDHQQLDQGGHQHADHGADEKALSAGQRDTADDARGNRS